MTKGQRRDDLSTCRLLGKLLGRIRATPLYAAVALLRGRRIVVDGASMYPLLYPGDRVLFNRLAIHADSPRRGDVVLVRTLGQPAERLIKLIVGLPGEEIAVSRDRLWIDGRPLLFHQPVVRVPAGRWQLGSSEYFLLSYAAAVGTDSRHFGPVRRDALLGRASAVYWPPNRRRRLEAVPLTIGSDVE